MAEIVARRPTASPHRRFNIVLIKTSHYDDDGYVVMVADCAVRIVLGRDVTINLTAIDETNKRLNCEKLTAERRVQPVPARARHCATVAGRRDSRSDDPVCPVDISYVACSSNVANATMW